MVRLDVYPVWYLPKLPPFLRSLNLYPQDWPSFVTANYRQRGAALCFGAPIMGTNAIIAHSVIPFLEC